MKINRMFLYAAAFMLAAACGKDALPETVTPEGGNEDEIVTPAPEYAVSFTAYTENAPESKAAIGTNSESRPQTFWEDGDVISVYSSNQTTNTKVGFLFSTSLTEDSATATFGYEGTDFVEGNYVAIYPHKEDGRVVNFSAQPAENLYEGNAYRMAMVDVPASQTLVAGGVDRSAMIMTAYTEDPAELHFKNAVALVKFRVADGNVTSGKIEASEPLSGRFRADLLENDSWKPILIDYGQPTYGLVEFSSEEDLATDKEYYVAVRPTTLANGFGVYLSGKLVKSYPSVTKFERSKIYDLGTLAIPSDAPEELTLNFDFTDAAAMIGWPTTNNAFTDPTHQEEVTYTLDGVSYQFILSQPKEVTTKSWPYFCEEKDNNRLRIPNQRYLGFPVVDGYKLTQVEFTIVSGNTSAFVITSEIATGSGTSGVVAGGDATTGTKGDDMNFRLSGTQQGTQYWMKVGKAETAISSMTLTYLEVK